MEGYSYSRVCSVLEGDLKLYPIADLHHPMAHEEVTSVAPER